MTKQNNIIKIKINNSFIKLDQLLKLSGVVQTGGQAKIVILSNQVKVNQTTCSSRGKKLYNKDIIEYDDKFIEVISDVW